MKKKLIILATVLGVSLAFVFSLMQLTKETWDSEVTMDLGTMKGLIDIDLDNVPEVPALPAYRAPISAWKTPTEYEKYVLIPIETKFWEGYLVVDRTTLDPKAVVEAEGFPHWKVEGKKVTVITDTEELYGYQLNAE